VSSYEQKADVGRQVARLAWRAADAGGPVMRVEAAAGSGARVRLLVRGNVFSFTSGPGRPMELFLTRVTYLAETACRSDRMSSPTGTVELRT